jgi:hypothetical protein
VIFRVSDEMTVADRMLLSTVALAAATHVTTRLTTPLTTADGAAHHTLYHRRSEIYIAELRRTPVNITTYPAQDAFSAFTDHLDVLLAFYDYPAQHWVHLRTTTTESTFATVRPPTARHQESGLQGRPGSRWPSSSSSQPSTAGEPSTRHISSPWSAPAPPSRRESSSNDPTSRKEISKSHDTPIQRS